MKAIFILLSLIPLSTFAIPEDGYETVWKDTVHPWFLSMTEGEFQNAQNRRVKFFYLTKAENKKTLVIVPGRSEPAIKYAEVAYDMKDKGVDIFIIDHQGQGESERLLKDSNKGHVVNFEDYIKDFSQFMSLVNKIKNNPDKFLLAHSMGGAISARYLSGTQWMFKKAVLIAPMMKLNTDPYSELVARLYSKTLVAVGKGANYAPGYGPYNPEEDNFETNPFTSSFARHNMSRHIFTTWPHLAVGGPTARWVHESLKTTKKIDRIPYATKTLMFQAGQDEIVVNDRQTSFCIHHKATCELHHIPESKHEILMEKDSIRTPVMNQISSFFEL